MCNNGLQTFSYVYTITVPFRKYSNTVLLHSLGEHITYYNKSCISNVVVSLH